MAGATRTDSTSAASPQSAETAVKFTATTSGGRTVIDEATLEEGGFVTVHDSTLGDGEVLGSVRGTSDHLAPGYYRDVVDHLDDPLAEEDTLFGMARQACPRRPRCVRLSRGTTKRHIHKFSNCYLYRLQKDLYT